MNEALTLTLDIGTSSTRCLLWDIRGREIDRVRAQVRYRMRSTPDGGAEMDPGELFDQVASCIDQALQQAGDRASSIRAVGISTFWHSCCGLNGSGKPITPIYLWADNRPAAVAARLRHDLDERAIHARTGCVIHPSYYLARLVWLRETAPELYGKVTRWVSPSEYILARLFGPNALKVSVSMASGTGLFNQAGCAWDTETLQTIDIPAEHLSPIVDLHDACNSLQSEFAKRWPALAQAPFVPAVGDGACGNVGSGCNTPRQLALNLGTSGAIRALWDDAAEKHDALPPAGLWRYRVDGHRPIMGAAFSDGGNVYAYLARTLQLPPPEELEKQIAALSPTSLIFLPFLAGERSMGWNPAARGAFVGLRLDTTPVEMMRAAMEGVALRFALAAQRLRELFPEQRGIVASGGALGHSAAWSQIFADAIGQRVTLAAEPEASSRGAALLAMEATGIIRSAADVPARMGVSYDPDAARHGHYEQMLTRQEELHAIVA